MRKLAMYCIYIVLIIQCTMAHANPLRNLIADCSFEDPLPLWFEENGQGEYYVAKEYRKDAADGTMVMIVKGWQHRGSKILSPVITLPESTLSFSAKIRSYGPSSKAVGEIALFDEKGKKKIATFATFVLDGKEKWGRVEKKGLVIPQGIKKARLAFMVKGPHSDVVMEVDSVGFFAGKNIPEITDNTSYTFIEAETFDYNSAWKVRDHYPSWYSGFPSKMKMLAGTHAIVKNENKPAKITVNVNQGGKHRLWVRFVTVNHINNSGKFTVSLKQEGKIIAEKEFHDGDFNKYETTSWVWDCLDAKLKYGKAQIELARPEKGVSSVARKIDCFVLINRLDYKPNIRHFEPGYIRFVNESDQQEPFCLWIWIRRHQKPWYMNPGMLSDAGNSRGYYVPHDKELLLAAGDTSPWVRITDFLAEAGGRNNIQLIATRSSHVAGHVSGRIKGKLEFSIGGKRKIIKTILINQDNPRILLTLPADFKNKRAEIRSSSDYIDEKQALLEKLKKPAGTPPKYLDMSAHLGFSTEKDDLNVIEAEIAIIKQLGFNNIYNIICPAEHALAFNKEHHLLPNFRLSLRSAWSKRKENSMYHPDNAAIEKIVQDMANKNNFIKNNILSFDLMDEPHGMSYEQILKSALCVSKFRNYLKKEGFSPEKLGVESWDKVKPIGPAEKEKYPILFYHTAIFRLKAMPYFTKTITDIKNKYFSKKATTYCNYSPPISGASWTIRGVDPFFMHRNNSLEMPWSEDWLGYGVGVQHMSDIYALLRAAAGKENQPLGGYVVGSPSKATLIRMKLYTAIAAGLRQVSVYCYGPYYAGIDSWSRQLQIYQELSNSLHELGTIDEALHGTTRMSTDIAILYNRTTSIWADKNYTSENNNRYIHWALAHTGYDADFIPEEDIESGGLGKYKVLYIGGIQMREKCAEKISSWVKNGGVLFGCAGAGIRNEYNHPMRLLENVFGAESVDCQLVKNVGRPRYELRTQKSLAVINSIGKDTPQVEFDQLCFSEGIEPLDKAMTIAQTAKGHCAGVKNKFGKGIAIRIAAMPGISYVNEAVKGKDYDIQSYLPKKFGKALREFIVWPAKLANARRIAITQEPITEIVRYDGKDRAVVFVIDHDAVKKEKINFSLPYAGQFTKVYSASGEPVKIREQKNNMLLVTMPMNIADAIVLEK